MRDLDHRAARGRPHGTLSVAVVLALAGALFAANAGLSSDGAERQPKNLAQLTAAEQDRVLRLQESVAALQTRHDALAAEQVRLAGIEVGSPGAGHEVAGGKGPVSGPGVTVRLSDAPAVSQTIAGTVPDDLVVHEGDVWAVMNALWAGGAEAMTVMDERVISTSAVRCTGNVLTLHGRQYSPPYTIRAIGDPDELRAALGASPAVQVYLQYVDEVGLGWQLNVADDLDFPAYEGAADLTYARVPDGIEVLPGLVVGASVDS